MWLTKSEEETDKKYGKNPGDRTLEEQLKNSVVIVDKHSGPTSHQISFWVKEIFGLNKTGHSGTLDPAVTGVLPVALENAVKAMPVLSGLDKEYVGVMHLHKEVPEDVLKNSVENFIGKIKQTPPVRSAVARREREREIYFFDIVEINDRDVLFKVGCEAGTYIRKLCVSGNTELILSDGRIEKIKDLVKKYTSEKLPVKLPSFNDCKILDKEVTGVQKIENKKPLLRITTFSGISVDVTPDHKILVDTQDGPNWVQADNLKVSDSIYSPNKIEVKTELPYIVDLIDDETYIKDDMLRKCCINGIKKKFGSIREMSRQLKLDRKAFFSNSRVALRKKYVKMFCDWTEVKKHIRTLKTEKGKIIELKNKKMTKELVYLLGLVASDGCVVFERKTIRPTRIKFHNLENLIIGNFINNYEKVFPGLHAKKKILKTGLIEVDAYNPVFANIAYNMGIKSPEKERDFKCLLNLPKNFIKAFLKGYFEGDGTTYYGEKSGRTYANIEFVSGFYLTAKRLYQLLKRIGIRSKIFTKKSNSGFKSSTGYVYAIRILGNQSKLKFIREVGTDHQRKRIYFAKILKKLGSSDFIDDDSYVSLRAKYLVKQALSAGNVKIRSLNLGGNVERVFNSDSPMTDHLFKRVLKKLSKILSKDSLEPLLKELESEFRIETITKIEKVRSEKFVYDLTVNDTHNFIPEGCIVISNCHDIGQKVGVGAHMTELRRTKVGNFAEKNAVSLTCIKDAYEFWKAGDESGLKKILIPIEFAIDHVKKIFVKDSAISQIANGAPVYPNGITRIQEGIEAGETISVFSLKNELIALGITKMTSEEMLNRKKGAAVRTDRVFMERGIYP